MAENFAILGRKVCLNVGSPSNPKLILNRLDISIPQGCIYGLIGPSGSGKTTLQRCCLGIYRPSSGSIAVFGKPPGSRHSKVPGPMVGYMPQDVTLDEELTIREQLNFLGRLNGLPMETINTRMEEILGVMGINQFDKIASQFSIGQQRRLSLACTLIHRPRLLLLDEPTVGSDIVVVKRIWDYLKHLRDTEGTTIVISTHYLEEVTKADYFGFMANGSMVVQSNPRSFMQASGTKTLEEAILIVYQKFHRNHSSEPDSCQLKAMQTCPSLSTSYLRNNQSTYEKFSDLPSLQIILLLIWRYLMRWRVSMVTQLILLMSLIIILGSVTGNSYGLPMKNMALGYVDHNENSKYLQDLSVDLSKHNFRFIHMLDEIEARHAVENGSIAAYLLVPENFDENLEARIISPFTGHGEDEQVLKQGRLILHQDTTHIGKVLTVQRRLYEALNDIMKGISDQAGLNPGRLDFIKFQALFEPQDEADRLASKHILLIRFMNFAVETYTMLLLTSWLLKESHENTNERLLSLGIKRYHLMLSLVVLSAFILTAIYVTVFGYMVWILGLPMKGDWTLVTVIIFCTTICGISKSKLIASLVNSDIDALVLNTFYAALVWIFGCVAWPFEAMGYFIQPLAYLIPHLVPTNAITRITIYGEDINQPTVQFGLMSSLVWAGIHLILIFSVTRKW